MPRFTTISVIAFLAAALAGCGGGSSSPPTTSTGSPSTAAEPGTKFDTADIAGIGTVLVDAKGRTVYILTSDAKKNVPCTDASGCTDIWPDLPLPDGTPAAKAGTGVDASLLGTMKDGDETYPTYNGYLMYEYASDLSSGQANGQGITSFGGTWYVLSPSGDPITSGGMGGSGSGY